MSDPSSHTMSRRRFIEIIVGGIACAAFAPLPVGAQSSTDKMKIGVVGSGSCIW